jgi:hypothetical protein
MKRKRETIRRVVTSVAQPIEKVGSAYGPLSRVSRGGIAMVEHGKVTPNLELERFRCCHWATVREH